MQGIFQDFFIWLLKFLAVSVGLLTAARCWTLHRRKQLQAAIAKDSSGNPTQTACPQNPISEATDSPNWHRDRVMARMALVLTVCLAILGSAWLWLDGSRPWQPCLIWASAAFLTVGFCAYWLRRAKRRSLAIREIRQLSDLLDLAALRFSASQELELAFGTTERNSPLSEVERHLSRLSPSLHAQFIRLRNQPKLRADDLRSLADGVHRELEQRALNQAARVSRWGKYPLLAGLVPVMSLLLASPFTEWALDRITGKPALTRQSPANSKNSRGDEEPRTKSAETSQDSEPAKRKSVV